MGVFDIVVLAAIGIFLYFDSGSKDDYEQQCRTICADKPAKVDFGSTSRCYCKHPDGVYKLMGIK